ncbi:MAG: signal peptidase II [Firmicutes bacterium]|nr:signal peptidase II [Bacillota bacterium]
MKKVRYLVILGVLLIDYLVKLLVRCTMYCGQTIPVIDGIFSITYVQNRGAAFSLFTGRGPMIMTVTFVALCLAAWYMERHKNDHWTLLLSLELIISGGVGNLLDRAVNGFVTDMFDIHFFPVFNIADIAICTGCGFLILYMFFFDKPDENT